MNLAETLAARGVPIISKSSDMLMSVSNDEDEVTASFGIANDSFHWGIQDVVPPKNTVPVENPGDELDKKRRKSKSFRKYEKQLQDNQGHGKVMVTTQQVDNSDMMDSTRSNWFV